MISAARKLNQQATDEYDSTGLTMQPLRFSPIFKHALWGGRRLGTVLNKSIGEGTDFAESWEIADLPDDRSVVAQGPFAGKSIRELMVLHAEDLLGRHAELVRFPLLVKFLDANQDLSVQVHPGQAMAQRYPDVTTGKAEAWVVLQAQPGSRISAGLKPDVDRQRLQKAIADGTVTELLHTYEVSQGDCLFLEPGTVHSLGAGVLVAEIQQPNNITYRLDDWGRLGSDGKPRELHTDLALEAINFSLGEVHPIKPQSNSVHPTSKNLIDNEFFVVIQHGGPARIEIPQDGRAHVLTAIQGHGQLLTENESIRKGETVLLPANREPQSLQIQADSLILDSFLN